MPRLIAIDGGPRQAWKPRLCRLLGNVSKTARRWAYMLPPCLRPVAPFRRASMDKITLDIGQTTKPGDHHPSRAGRCISLRLGQRQELPARVHNPLDDGEQVEGRAGQTIDPRHRHDTAGDNCCQHLEQFTAVSLCGRSPFRDRSRTMARIPFTRSHRRCGTLA